MVSAFGSRGNGTHGIGQVYIVVWPENVTITISYG